MQLFALDKEKKIIPANRAGKKRDYYCPECGSILRLRGGLHKKVHFFHLGHQSFCRQSQKSAAHLQVQYFFEKLFSSEHCFLEKQFPEIGRIADVVWESEKIVFEVQCSMISSEEVACRNKDYRSIGYEVIWILHERKFNRLKVSAAEIFLRNSPYYYTNMDSLGHGEIYDQIDSIHGGIRQTYKKLFGIRLDNLKRNLEKEEGVNPSILQSRSKQWPIYFAEDLIDRWRKGDEKVLEILERAFKDENSYYKQVLNPASAFFFAFFKILVVRPYLLFFRIFLEKACR